MTREDFLKKLIDFSSQKAKELGYNEIDRRENRQKGIWDPAFTDFLEKLVGGDCASEIVWWSSDKKFCYIEFRFRFENPCVAIKWDVDGYECLVEFQFSNRKLVETGEYYNEDSSLHKKGDPVKEFVEDKWRIAQVMMWNLTVKEVEDTFNKWKGEIMNLIEEANNG